MMTADEMLSGIALKLGGLYPERLVYYKKIPANADGNHFVRCINQSHTVKLGRQRNRSYGFEVLYFSKKNDPLEFNAWADTMYTEFETLTASGQLYHVKNAHAEPGDDMVFHFIFDVDVDALVDPDKTYLMETLTETTEVV